MKALFEKFLVHFRVFNPWVMAIVIILGSEIISAIMNTILSFVWWGEFSKDLVMIGVIDAFIVPLCLMPLVFQFAKTLRSSFDLQKMNKILEEELLHRRAVERELRESREQLLRLSAHLQTLREKERARIAREVHDELGQSLTAIKMNLGWLKNQLSNINDTLFKKANDTVNLLDDTIRIVKRISTELRPPLLDYLGLGAAVKWQTEEFEKHSGIECTLEIIPEDIVLDQPLSIDLFRILQEGLTNVAKHSKATNVMVSLKQNKKEISLIIEDNGRGFDTNNSYRPTSLGIIGIKERVEFWGGNFEIKNREKGGTLLKITIPLNTKEGADDEG